MAAPDCLPITILSQTAQPQYVDGSESRLLEIYREADPAEVQATVHQVLREGPTWPERFHLSPQRQHLVDWFPFEADADLLEVGAGCGALTGVLAERVAHVDALEPTFARANVIAHRHRERSNVSVLLGDLTSVVATDHKYRYITLIGVLEYAGRFGSTGKASDVSPYLRLLAEARAVLSDGGHLLLAIENQIGLKYLAGTPEDHYGAPLVGIEDYAWDGGIRTFGRGELGRLLETAGFEDHAWYYPFPDYKLPTAIYSDALPPGSIEHPSMMHPSTDYAHQIDQYFSEARLARILLRNNLSGAFANSFLVVCRAT